MVIKRRFSLTRVTALLLTLVCVFGILPASASAASQNTIKLESFGMSGVEYESAALGECTLHQMNYDYGGISTTGFCGEKGRSMGRSLIGQTWGNPQEITDPTVKLMMAYFYSHSTGTFTDAAHAYGVDNVWDAGYNWYMNAWIQAVIWRYKEQSLGADPVAACAEELLAVYNVLEGTNYTSIDDELDGQSFRHRTQYIFDLGNEGVWGDCTAFEYSFTGPGTTQHPAADVQSVVIGELSITQEEYTLIVKKVDSTNPTKGLPGAKFSVQSTNGAFYQEVITGADGTYTLFPMDPGTYAVTELEPPPGGYRIDNAGPEYVALPSNGSNTVTIVFRDTPEITGEGSIRKVDADDPTKGLDGAEIKITGVDNNFTGTYVTRDGGYLLDVPWDSMPIGSYVAEELTPPANYSLSPDPAKVRQEFYWDGRSDVALIFENDSKVKVQLIKLDDSDNPLPGAVFSILKDGQYIGSEATDAEGKIVVTGVTEGVYAFVEESAPAPFAKLLDPVIAHVDQAVIEGGGTVTVSAADKRLPNLQIKKIDAQTREPVPDTTFEIKGIHYGYHQDVTTGDDGIATLTAIPVDSYEVREKSVPEPYCIAEEDIQTIFLGPGADQELIFENYKQPLLKLSKISFGDDKPVPNTVLTVEGIDNDYKDDWTTGEDGTVTKYVPAGTFRITEKSVPLPFYLPDKDADRVQEISLNPGDEKTVQFVNHRMPELTIYKESEPGNAPVEGTRFHVSYVSNGAAADAPATIDFGYFLTDENGEIKLHESGKRLYPGEYTVTEVEPSPGFQPSKTPTQKVILNGSESKTLTFQNAPLNAIIVEKYDSVSGEALSGVTFQLRYLSGESGTGGTVIGQKVTGKNGTAIWTGLKAGAYIIEELDPGDEHIIINSSETVYLADSGEQSVVTVRFENAPFGILLIRKVCSVNPSVTLADAEFKIMYADGTLIGDSNGIFRTDENGEIRIEGLHPGKSVIATETAPPPGFLIDTQSQTIQIKAGRTVSLTFKNQPTGKLLVQKRNSITNEVLPGAEFRLTTAAGCEVGLDGVIGDATLTQNGIFRTNSQGEVLFTNLAPGAYVLSEISSPSGFLVDQPSINVVIGTNGDTQTVVVKNTPKAVLQIVKKELGTNEPLANIEFIVKTSSGEYVANDEGAVSSNGVFYTNEAGQITITGLKPDTYTIYESASLPTHALDATPRTVKLDAGETHTEIFYNQRRGSLVINKLSSADRKTPLEGVTFKITYANGEFVPNAGGKISSNGLYYTDSAGQITIHGVTGTLVVTELESIPGFTIDESSRSQTVVVNPDDVQTLYFYNDPIGGVELIKVNEDDPTERIPNTTFEIRKMDDGLVDTITTDRSGRAFLSLEDGSYYAVEVSAGEGFRRDATPQYFEVKDGKTTVVTVTNRAFSGILLRKIDSVTREGIYGVSFILYDSSKTPIGQYTSDDQGYVYIEDLPSAGRYYLRELENEGYLVDEQLKTVVVEPGGTTEVIWENTPITGQIQIWKKSADDNPINGLPAGTALEGALFEIYDKANRLVDTVKSNNRGLAASKPLPLGRYTVQEVSSPAFYSTTSEPVTVYLEHEGQIVQIEVLNKSVYNNVSVNKTGYTQVVPGQSIRYTFKEIANDSTTPLDNFYWRDTLPTDAVRLDKIITGTWSAKLNYKVVFKTNVNDGYQVLADNLSTQKNYTLDASAAALGLASNEYITQVTFLFGRVPAGFTQVETPYIYCNALSALTHEYRFTNKTDVGGLWQGQWVMATDRWVTITYRGGPVPKLPRTGY